MCSEDDGFMKLRCVASTDSTHYFGVRVSLIRVRLCSSNGASLFVDFYFRALALSSITWSSYRSCYKIDIKIISSK